jgi:hypothetical protein
VAEDGKGKESMANAATGCAAPPKNGLPAGLEFATFPA